MRHFLTIVIAFHWMAVLAMAAVSTPVRVMVAGAADSALLARLSGRTNAVAEARS